MFRSTLVTGMALLVFAMVSMAAEVTPQGKVFTDFMLDARSEKDRGGDPLTSFNIKRAYLGAKGKLSDDQSFKVTYDVSHSDGTGNYQAFAKNAELSWKNLVPKTTLTFGLTGTTTFSLTEKAWGHRGIEKAGPDLWKLRSSADLGLMTQTNYSEMVQLHAGIFNGEGYKKQEADGFKLLQVRPVLTQSGVTISPYVDFTQFDDAGANKNQVMVGGFVGYAQKHVKVGVDALLQSHDERNALLIWGFVRYLINDQFEVFARADHYDPDQDAEEDDSQLVIVGIAHTPVKAVEVALDFQLHRHDGANASKAVAHTTFSF